MDSTISISRTSAFFAAIGDRPGLMAFRYGKKLNVYRFWLNTGTGNVARLIHLPSGEQDLEAAFRGVFK